MGKVSLEKIGRIICMSLFVTVLFNAELAVSAEKDKKPFTKYWMSVATQNFSIPGMPSDMPSLGGMFGNRMGGPGRNLFLQLNSPQSLPSDPAATHDIPPGQLMGDTLPLVIPAKPKKERTEDYKESPEPFEKPKARMLIYWGCGENVRSSQPRVLDTEKMSPAEFGKAMSGRTGSPQHPPAPRSGWIYSEWPNEKKRADIPKESSLKGEHFVHGNYSPDIRFSIGEKQDFMSPVEFTSVKGSRSESIQFQWRAIPTAIGYFAMAMAYNEKSGEAIIWTSSEVAEPGYGLMDYLPSSDVRRFIKEKAVMPPDVTGCAIPKGIFKDAEGAMLQFIAYGEDLHLAYPPKPKDPKKPWDIIWTVNVRLKSTGMMPLSAAEHSEAPQAKRQDRERDQTEKSQKSDEKPKENEDSGGALKKAIKGLFGF